MGAGGWPANEEMRGDLVNPALEWLAGLDDAGFRELFRKSPVKRSKFAGLRRNLAIAMGNGGDARFAAKLEQWSRDADEMLAEHATWGLSRIQNSLSRTQVSDNKEGNGQNAKGKTS